MKIIELLSKYTTLLDTHVTVNGWVRSVRFQSEQTFIDLNDGSCASGIQLIASSTMEGLTKINTGTSLSVCGLLVRSPKAGQACEIQVLSLTVYGYAQPEGEHAYPLSKTKLTLDYLRGFAHLRARTSTYSSVFRIKSSIYHATHDFFYKRGFPHVNPNIITVTECEGGAGLFQITEHDISDHSTLPTLKNTTKHDWSRDHCKKPIYLTCSSQLQLEAIACAIGRCVTTNKSFRSEHSLTHKHVSEFDHLEVEDTFITLDSLMQLGEDYIKYVGQYLLDHCREDLTNLDKFISKGIVDRVTTITSTIFHRLKYDDAIKILKQATTLSQPVVYGEDLCSEFENYLTIYFKGPVFVSHWPLAIKSFYMKRCPDKLTCENFDLLMPYKVGELIGGSMREDQLDTMLEVMAQKNISTEPLQFYLDLRRFGTVPHGGFGLGLDRMTMLFTGMENIRDVIAFPVTYGSCSY
jgi:asparaginyl-tRNA synthetase